ncbi:hypothetical protein MMPV_008562 [Pyropia vietnamensis]
MTGIGGGRSGRGPPMLRPCTPQHDALPSPLPPHLPHLLAVFFSGGRPPALRGLAPALATATAAFLTAATLPPTVVTWAARSTASRDSYLPFLADSLAVVGRPEWVMAVVCGSAATACLLLTTVAIGGWRSEEGGTVGGAVEGRGGGGGRLPATGPAPPTKSLALALLAAYALAGVWVTGRVSAAAYAAAAAWAACAVSLSVTFVHLQAHLERLSCAGTGAGADGAPVVGGDAADEPPALSEDEAEGSSLLLSLPTKLEAFKAMAVRKLRPACVSGMWVAVGKTAALVGLTSTAGIMRHGWVRMALWTARASAEYTAVFFGVVVLWLLAVDLRSVAAAKVGQEEGAAALRTEAGAVRRPPLRFAPLDEEEGGRGADADALRLAVWR